MYYADLTYFDDNPWQPRQTVNPERLQELAVKIFRNRETRPDTKGLLQLPAARLVDSNSHLVPLKLVQHIIPPSKGDLSKFLKGQNFHLQICWGHRRRLAFALLTEGFYVPGPDGEPGEMITSPDYYTFPFDLVEFSNLEMFEMAVTENGDRDDLTVIETARAMATYRDQFHKSSREIGQLFGGMSDSAVRNMIRLLDLPEEPRRALEEGRMSQGAGRALLSFYALPEPLQNGRGRAWHRGEYWDGKRLVAAALEGMIASQVDLVIDALLKENALDMSAAPWKHSDVFPELEHIEHPDCKTCPARVTRSGKQWCTVRACYYAKQHHWQQDYLEQAGRAADLPAFDGNHDKVTTFEWSSRQPVLVSAYERRCPNLCVAFNQSAWLGKGKGYEKVTVEGFPGAEMVCKKMNQHCTCLQALNAGVSLPAPTPTPARVEPDYENGKLIITLPEQAPAALSENDLKTVRQEIRDQKVAKREQSKAIREEVERQVLNSLSLFSLQAWKLVAKKIKYDCGREAKTWDELSRAIAKQLVEDAFDFINLEDFDHHERKAKELLKGLGVSVETGNHLTPGPSPQAERGEEVAVPAGYNADWLES